jgi:hypothetical protein
MRPEPRGKAECAQWQGDSLRLPRLLPLPARPLHTVHALYPSLSFTNNTIQEKRKGTTRTLSELGQGKRKNGRLEGNPEARVPSFALCRSQLAGLCVRPLDNVCT